MCLSLRTLGSRTILYLSEALMSEDAVNLWLREVADILEKDMLEKYGLDLNINFKLKEDTSEED